MRNLRLTTLTAITMACISTGLGGCVAEDNDSAIDLGSVSIGDQLIDLKKARDAGAISGNEYRKLKADLLTLVGNATSQSTDEQHIEIETERDDLPAKKNTDDDDSGFLF